MMLPASLVCESTGMILAAASGYIPSPLRRLMLVTRSSMLPLRLLDPE